MGMVVDADTSGIQNYVDTVGGILQAVEDPRFEGDFLEHLASRVETTFMVESIAAKSRIPHVFEWGRQQGQISNIPLFRLTRNGEGGTLRMSYTFLPSTRKVPLPDPNRYGFSADKLQYLTRHTFQLKAMVMETRNQVTIAPRKKLFIPSQTHPEGYYMTSTPQTINPGGPNTTGAFASWWAEWFSSRAQVIVNEESEQTENWLVATGAKYVRYAAGTVINGKKVGGQFARGRNVNFSYENPASKRVKERVMREAQARFKTKKYDREMGDFEDE